MSKIHYLPETQELLKILTEIALRMLVRSSTGTGEPPRPSLPTTAKDHRAVRRKNNRSNSQEL